MSNYLKNKKDAERYTRIAVQQAGQAIVTGAITAYTGYAVYEVASFKWSIFRYDPIDVIQKKAVGVASKDDRAKCDLESKLVGKVGTAEYEHTYRQCLNNEVSLIGHGPWIGMAFWMLTMCVKSLWRSAGYLHLGHMTRKGDPFRQFGKGLSPVTAVSHDTAPLPEFKVENGISPQASVMLPAGSAAYSERGAFMAKNGDVTMDVLPLGEKKSIANLGSRLMSGEGVTLMRYRNPTSEPKELILNTGGSQLVSIDLPANDRIFCKNGAYFASTNPVQVGLFRIRNFSFTAFSGHGMTMQSIDPENAQGATVLLNARGQVSERTLKEGEIIEIQKRSLLAFNSEVSIGLRETGTVFGRAAMGESHFMTAVKGPGRIWLETTGAGAEDTGAKTMLGRFIPG